MIRSADLQSQNASIGPELERAIQDVIARGEFILGTRVREFESAFARYCGADEAVGVSSGTSALHLALLGAGIGPGDEVITTSFSFVATVAAIGYTGARPVLADIDPVTFTIDPGRIAELITPRTRAIVPVHLYGQPADLYPILDLARHHGLRVVEDAAQAHGAQYRGRPVGSLGDAGCFSFYPGKNLGAFGEAGAVVTSLPDLARSVRMLRDWGQGTPYHHAIKGFNARMDGIQGAVLGVKLAHLDRWNEGRRAHAARYDEAIGPGVTRPAVAPWGTHVYHQYVIRTAQRALLRAEFERRSIETRIHYPVPIHLLDAWKSLGYREGDFPHAEQAAREVVSIPVHPELTEPDVDAVVAALEAVSSVTLPSRTGRDAA